MIRRLARTVLVLAVATLVSGHVGSPNVYFEGAAGPYPVRVTVRLPGVVPGLAQITVRVEGDAVHRVTVRPVRWDAGLEGAPAPDVARPVPNAPGLYSAELWLMTGGSYSVHVTVEGSAGTGTVIVPVQSVALRTLAMDRVRGTVLLGLCALLVFGLLTLVGAAAREGTLPSGAVPDARRRRRARRAQGVAAVLLVAALAGGRWWWAAIDTDYRDDLYEPLRIEATTRAGHAGRTLRVAIVDPSWTEGRWTPFVPDHGKLMHLFLIRAPGLDVFAHLHPAPVDSATFEAPLPPLPAGRYRLYAGVVHESGFTQTLTDTLDLPAAVTADGVNATRTVAARAHTAAAAGAATSAGSGNATPTPADGAAAATITDPDDSWRGPVAGVAAPGPGGASALADGYTLRWVDAPARLLAERELTLRFLATGSNGEPATIEPYMGMAAHAAITRDDGAVFVHLHPMGTISVAAQERLARGTPGGDAGTPHGTGTFATRHAPDRTPGTVSFPYAFPRPGRYRIWVQVRLAGRVRTGVFTAEVAPAG